MELHTDRIKVPPLVPAAPSGPVAAGWVAFEAPTTAGPLRLWVWGGVRHAADAALLLDGCSPLLDAVDAWLDFAPAWRWCAQGPSAEPAAPHARAQWQPADGHPSCRIDLPWPLLRGLPPPSEPFAAQLRWATTPAVLVLAQMRLADDEVAALEPGGAVLLPASMHADWQGRLRAGDEPATPATGLAVALPRPWAPEAGRSADAVTSADDGWYEVRLGMPQGVDARALAGWRACEPFDRDSRASLWRCAGESGPAGHLASGVLTPWGDGWALLIDAADPA